MGGRESDSEVGVIWFKSRKWAIMTGDLREMAWKRRDGERRQSSNSSCRPLSRGGERMKTFVVTSSNIRLLVTMCKGKAVQRAIIARG